MRLCLLLLLAACNPKPDTGGEDPSVDLDEDGYVEDVDCDDEDPEVNPGAEEQPYDGVDNDCDSSTPDDDLDGDGYANAYGEDCDDGDASVFPGAAEYCDGKDNDCDLVVDEGALDTLVWYRDNDGDGYGDPHGQVLACEQPVGTVLDDTDCDDRDPGVHPGAEEPYDGVDNDCDGEVDEEGGAPEFTWYHDNDTDGYGDPLDWVEAQTQPASFVANDNDCDDEDWNIYPGAPERCNGRDDDCDDVLDEDDVCLERPASDADDWWTGDDAGDEAGMAVAGGLDLTGDGSDDFLIGAPSSSVGGSFYFLPGEHHGLVTGMALDAASSSGAISWTTPAPGAELGSSMALFPDLDGDGGVDFGVGAPGADDDATDSGVAVLWFSSVDEYVFVSSSAEGAELGTIASAGWVDSDGLSDLLVGAPGLSSGAPNMGFVELFLGHSTELIEAGAYWLGQSAQDDLGTAVDTAGDIDGDGLNDLLLGAPGYSTGQDTGAVWLQLGRGNWPGAEASVNDCEHQLVGVATGDRAGWALTGGQDFDADGYDDFAIGAPFNTGAGSSNGTVYLFSGGVAWRAPGGANSLASAPVILLGESTGARTGWSLELVPDHDGDRVADLVVGAPWYSVGATQRGKVYVVPGGRGAWLGTTSLADAPLSWIGDASGDYFGYAIAGGDADADGIIDLVVGAPGDDANGSGSGTVHLIFGF
jgi:hypothetical protein